MQLEEANKLGYLRFEDVSVIFQEHTINEVRALKNCSLSINQGEVVFILGHNGSGKSSLLNAISKGIFCNGKIYLDKLCLNGIPEYQLARYITKVSQELEKSVISEFTVEENFALSLIKQKYRLFNNALNSYKRAVITEHLKTLELGLEDRLDCIVGNLSGGQKQMIALSMAFFSNIPKLFIFDEPTASIDEKVSELSINFMLNKVRKEKITTLWVTHDITQALKFADRIIILIEGAISNILSKEKISEITKEKLLSLMFSTKK